MVLIYSGRAVTFEDLKKRVSLEVTTQQKYRLTERLQNKPFWIWSVDEHKQEDVRTKEECCFNHLIGLSRKGGYVNQLYDYEKIIFDSLVTEMVTLILPTVNIFG
jgi:hypothetical protein